MKSKILLQTLIMIILLSTATNICAEKSPFYVEQFEEAVKIKEKINVLMPQSYVDVYGLKKVQKNAENVATSIYEIEQLHTKWIYHFLNMHSKENAILTKKDTINLINAFHYWAYIYEGLLFEQGNSKIYNISYKVTENILINNNALENFIAWINKLGDAEKEAFDILKKDKEGWVSFGRGFVKGFTLIGFISPDQRGDIEPSMAVKAVKPYKDNIKDYFADEWYFMIREYIEIQNCFFHVRKLIQNIIKHYSGSIELDDPGFFEHTESVNSIKKYSVLADLYFKKLDTMLRGFIFDRPICILSNYSYLRARAAKHWLDDDEELLNAFLDFLTIKEFKFTVDPFTDEVLIYTRKEFKESYDSDEEKEISAQAKLRKEWYALLPKVKEPQPDSKFE